MTFIEPLPIGTAFLDGETLEIAATIDAPGCVNARGEVYGVHPPGSPWYQHWCVDLVGLHPYCRDEGVSSFIKFADLRLTGTSGTIVLVAEPGVHPPENLRSVPSLGGFVPCYVLVSLNDGRIGGRFHDFSTGEQCWPNASGCIIPRCVRFEAGVPRQRAQ